MMPSSARSTTDNTQNPTENTKKKDQHRQEGPDGFAPTNPCHPLADAAQERGENGS
jgi:hypothetical protein